MNINTGQPYGLLFLCDDTILTFHRDKVFNKQLNQITFVY
jgi:hypothetical protein